MGQLTPGKNSSRVKARKAITKMRNKPQMRSSERSNKGRIANAAPSVTQAQSDPKGPGVKDMSEAIFSYFLMTQQQRDSWLQDIPQPIQDFVPGLPSGGPTLSPLDGGTFRSESNPASLLDGIRYADARRTGHAVPCAHPAIALSARREDQRKRAPPNLPAR